MNYHAALALATGLRNALSPSCHRIEIAGSIRRRKDEPNDVEIVCIPQDGGGMFGDTHADAFVAAVHASMKVTSGDAATGRHIKGLLPCGTKVDLYACAPHRWGYRLLLSTGSAEHNIVIVTRLAANGYTCKGGDILWKGTPRKLPDEADVFALAGLRYVEPQFRTA